MKKIIAGLSIPVLLAITLFTCNKQEEKKEMQSAKTADESAIAISLAKVEEGTYSQSIVCSGLINTETEARLSFKIGGIIASIPVEEGQSVAKGQLLASLNLTEIDAQVAQAKNNFEKTKRDLERGKRLFQDSAATVEQIQNLQTAYDVASEALNIATFNRNYATIRATTSGKIIRKFMNEGEQVSAGSPVFILNSAAPDEWIVKAGLSDVDWVRIKAGDKANITTDAHPGVVFEAEVKSINEGAEPVSGLYQAEIKIKPTNKKLASGLVARVTIIPAEKRKLKSVPIEAIIEGNGKQAFVFILQPDQKSVKKVKVTIAYVSDNRAFISEGLESAPEVVTGGAAFLTEASTVSISK